MGAALPPVVLLHGWGGSFAATWGDRWSAASADAGRDVVAFELPGHSRPASHDPVDYADLAGTLDARLGAASPVADRLSLAGVDHLSLPAHPAFLAAALDFLATQSALTDERSSEAA